MRKTLAALSLASALACSARAEIPAYLMLSGGAPGFAAENLLTADRAVVWTVDRVAASRYDTLRTTRGALHRALRLAFLDLPIDYMPMLIQHEAFGHGTRMREAGYGTYGIRVSPLWPYGSGHGYTVGARPPADVSLDESLAIHGAGMDANDVFARSLRMRWVADGRLDRHQAALYAFNAGNRPAYLFRTWSGFAATEGAGDLNLMISALNYRNGGRALSNRPLDIDDLAYRSLPALLDPFAWIALWAALDRHVARGRPDGPLPMPSIGSVRLLPMARTGFAPFGPEYYLECLAAQGRRTYSVSWRQSDPGMEDAYGLGLAARDAAYRGDWSLDVRAEFWRQPGLRLAGSWREQGGERPRAENGAGLWLTFRWREERGLLLELGAKSRGYVQGEPLGAILMARGGLSFAWPL